MYRNIYRVNKSRFTVVSMQNTVYSCIIIFNCIIFHMNKCKTTFVLTCILLISIVLKV